MIKVMNQIFKQINLIIEQINKTVK